MAEAQKKENEDDFEVEFEDDDAPEVEVVDDTPEEDRKYAKKREADDDDDKPKAEGDDDEDDDERQKYSESVQKRINKLKYDYHEERRQREQAERLSQEATEHTRRLQEELTRLRRQSEDSNTIIYQQAEGRIEAVINGAKRELKEAYEAGDSEKIVEAQAKLSTAQAEKVRLDAYKASRPQKTSPENYQQQQPQAKPQPQRPQPSEKAKRWAQDNPWFDENKKMRGYAIGIHNELVTKQGVQPDTDEYYRQIDKEMRKVFPSYFNEDDEKSEPVVAAPSRKAPKKPRTVKLTKTQVAFAKRLGITPQQYAAQIIKDQSDGN